MKNSIFAFVTPNLNATFISEESYLKTAVTPIEKKDGFGPSCSHANTPALSILVSISASISEVILAFGDVLT